MFDISETVAGEISNNSTFNGNSAAIGCTIGSTQVTITNYNNTTASVQHSAGQSNRVGNAPGTSDRSQAVDDRSGSNVATETDEGGSGNLSPHDGNDREDDRMLVDQDAYSGQTNQAAHILGNASNVHILGSKIQSIAGNSLKTTSKLVY